MKIVIGSDHAGFQLKNAMGDLRRSMGNEVLDVGAFNENIGVKLAEDLVKAFLAAKFTNEERHVRRLGKIKALEAKCAAAGSSR